MPRVFVHFTFLLFIITAISGVWMRAFPFMSKTIIPYTNVLHGHSHLAILGWAFLGAFIVFLTIIWPQLKSKTHGMVLTITLFIVSLLMFVAFAYEGYAKYSIIMSTVHIFIEYWAILFIYQQLKADTQFPKVGKLFINGSLIALLLSSIGPFMLGFIAANGLRDSYLFDITIYFYLHFQYNGWLFLFLIGTFLFILHKKGVYLHFNQLKRGFWIYFISLFPGYFSSILWVDLGIYGYFAAMIGSIGQWVGVLYILFAARNSWSQIVAVTSKVTSFCLTITFLFLLFKSTMELGLISPTVADLVYETRSIIIGYLHFTLLGFISIFILSQFQMLHLIDTTRKSVLFGLLIFLCGFLLNELLLFVMGLASWVNIFEIPFYTQGLLMASLLLLVGIIFLWYSVLKKKQ